MYGLKQKDEQAVQGENGGLLWERKPWTPEQNGDSRDGWKVFKTEKPLPMTRWWEEDWEDDRWWTAEDSSSSSSSSFRSSGKSSSGSRNNVAIKKSSVNKQKGENVSGAESNQAGGGARLSAKERYDHRLLQKESSSGSRAIRPTSKSQTSQTKNAHNAAEQRRGMQEYRKVVIPKEESPSEKTTYVLHGNDIISPFEDPEPGPHKGPSDEVPDEEKWEYHRPTGLGRYIDHRQNMGLALDHGVKGGQKQRQAQKIKEEKRLHKTKANQKNKKTGAREIQEGAEVLKHHKSNNVAQFYGFGLETPSSVNLRNQKKMAKAEQASRIKVPTESLKITPAKENNDNYNKGIIYDVASSFAQRSHPSQNNLVLSVKDPVSSENAEDFGNTKASLQTSPNPPPPGIAKEAVDPETTPMSPQKKTKKGGKKSYLKSHPLTFCKLESDCRKGRKCRRGVCVCLPAGGCTGHKPVCGSDGVLYPSHCELHRTACVTRLHIRVDRDGLCFQTTALEQKTSTTTASTTTTTTTTTTATTVKNTEDLQTVSSTPSQIIGDDDDEDDEDDYDEDEYYDVEYEDDYDYEEDDEEDEEEDDGKEQADDNDEQQKAVTDHDSIVKMVTPPSDLVRQKAAAQNAEDIETKEQSVHEDDQVNDVSQTGDKQDASLAGGDDHVKGSPEGEGEEEEEEDKEEYDYQSDGTYEGCSQKELNKFKRQLLVFYCERFQEPDCKLEVREERNYLTNLLFSYLDMDTDYLLSFRELRARQDVAKFPEISKACQLTDLIWNDDTVDIDGHVSLEEFEDAFSDLFDEDEEKETTLAPSQFVRETPVVHVIPTLATVGNGLELKCGLSARGNDVLWRRHDVNIRDLAMPELLVLDDGSLFFSKMGVHHMGNYSCQDITDASMLQVHSLKVQMPPTVRVSPHSQIEPSQVDVKMRCHAEGVPRPTISWQMNDMALSKEPHRYKLASSNEQLTVYGADYEKDTGAYKCVAKNQAGTAEDVCSLFIIGEKEQTLGMGFTNVNSGKFAVFHKQGYTAYDPEDCLKQRNVHGDFGYFKFIPDNLDKPLRLCEEGQDCSWGQAVNVHNRFLYASQPALNRVVVIETTKNWIPVQVIATDKQPVQMYYVEHLDQVWVLCWNGEVDESTKTMVVVRDASKYVQHRVVHTQPVGNHFDQIQALFIAPANDLKHTYDYGYVTHNGQQGLTKLDLENMRYVKPVDLSSYDCVPRSLAFVPIGGHVVIECVSPVNHQTLQLIMDYITDAVVSTAMLSGKPYVSPDSRHVVTVDDLTGKVSVAGVNNEGILEAAYEVTVSASISDVAFFPALGHGYLLVLTSADDDDIITINLSTGKVDKMKGTNRMATSSDWYPSPVKRAITSGDVFSDYLLAPSKSSISIMDMRSQQVKCEYTATPHSKAAIFVGH